MAIAFALLLQAFGAASMPVMAVSQDGETVILCTGSGMKAVPLSDFGIDLEDNQGYPETMHPGGLCALCMAAHQATAGPLIIYIPALDLDAHAPQAPPPDRTVPDGFRSLPQGRAPPSNV